ncbi:MAG: biotin synthase [Sulfurospirillum sp.]|nr:MAG: biotin synthase [Sulfurospirillum sp.]
MPEKTVFLCAISNISSGSCSEDCSFCTQAAKYQADIERYRYKPLEDIVHEAKRARANRAIGFCLVTAGKGITDRTLEFVCEAAAAVKKVEPDLNIIACNGTASVTQLRELKEAGVGSYNHNLETSRAYYPEICTTHSWDERYETCENTKIAGLDLCSGGIFGMGESEEDRISMVASLKALSPASVAINFFHPNPALPLHENPLGIDTSLEIIRYVKSQLPESMVMVAGGRERMFGERQGEIFSAGADSIVIGNYLTTRGNAPDKDIVMLESLGLKIAQSCHG